MWSFGGAPHQNVCGEPYALTDVCSIAVTPKGELCERCWRVGAIRYVVLVFDAEQQRADASIFTVQFA